MQAKKVVLIISFFLVVGLLFAVVFMARNQVGNFGRDYDRHVSTQVEKYVRWFTNERAKVYQEVNGVVSDKLVRDMIVALYSGEDTTPYATQLEAILGKLSFLKKIQLLDPTGIVLYSTKPGEALVNRFVPDLLTQAMVYQETYRQPFLRFVSTNEFLVAQVLQQEEKNFHVVMYYDAARFSSPTYGLMIPWGKTILVSKRQKGQQEAAKIVEYASVDPAVLSRGKKTIGGMKDVDGIQVVYFSRYENYVSSLVIGIIIFAFVLLFLILYAFFRLLQEEKLYKQPLTFRHHPRDDLKNLVEDIEEGETLSSEEAKKGIEEMLMSEEIEDLTRSPSFAFGGKEEQKEKPESLSQEASFSEEAAFSGIEKYAPAESGSGEASLGESSFAEPSFDEMEKEFSSKEEGSFPEEITVMEPPSLSGLSSGAFQPDEATRLFAEQDKLLDEVMETEKQDTVSPEGEEMFLEPSFATAEEEAPSPKEELVLEPEFMKLEPELPEEKEVLEFETPSFGQEKGTTEDIEDLGVITEESPSLEVETEVLPLGDAEGMAEMGGEEVGKERYASEEVSSEEGEKEPSLEDVSLEEIHLDTIEMPEISLEEASPQQESGETLLESELPEEMKVADTLLEEISVPEKEETVEDEVIALNMEELSAIPVEETGMQTSPEMPKEAQNPQEKVMMFGEELHEDLAKLLSEPPKRISTIHDVPSYAKAAHDIAKSALGMNRVCVLEKRGEKFENVLQDGFQVALNLSTNDPLYKKVLAHHKSLDIQQNLEKASYLKQWFKDGELQNLEELFITPVIRDGEVVGVGIYGREKGTHEPTDLQKSELYNIGFLQEVE
ncbi:MAG: hypothetical protein N2314_02445 [Brevinematales bacterium]|nr:hypothetical protein [Brevinematales bacterium]